MKQITTYKSPMIVSKSANIHKLKLMRYYLLKQISSLFLATKTLNHSIYVWPPFDENQEKEYTSLISNVRHYLKGLDISVEYFLNTAAGIRRRVLLAPFDKLASDEIISLEIIKKNLRVARYCLSWRLDGVHLGSSVRPHVYYIGSGLGNCDADDWLRLTNDIYLQKHGTPNHMVSFSRYPVNSCAVVGTGPSSEAFIAEAQNYDAWICANSVACDERIRNVGHPFAICMLDPILFSPLDSVQPTLNCTYSLLRETPAVLITTRRFAAYIELNFPSDIKRKCHYVSTLGHDSLWLHENSAIDQLVVTPYGNVLTDLMLPVAASISKNIVLYGCDGKKPGSAGFFKKSEKISQIDEKQHEDISHYTDFDIYDQYIAKHNIFTRYVVDKCLSKSINIYLRKPSWNTGLQHLPVRQWP